MARKVLCSILAAHKVAHPDGLMRGSALLPFDAEILFMGQATPQGDLGLFFAAQPPIGPDNKERAFLAEEATLLEFVVVTPGATIPDEYQYRASVMTPRGPAFIFQQKPKEEARSKLIVPRR